jgi:hypothetical protein
MSTGTKKDKPTNTGGVPQTKPGPAGPIMKPNPPKFPLYVPRAARSINSPRKV